MTSIEQLQICGIRSFNPNPAHKQTVHFHKPLTVILGKNGAGKTTIIEALLNACTGSMPPGSGTEKSSFVYDPKVIGETEVKAQIRLIFTGKGAKVMQVIRSFQVTWSRNKTTFATLDNTVAFQDTASGKIISSTYRASDVDRVVPEMLGVSPAVLEHVILCHQEDCNWPLAPPKDVKRIFDDIFAATRYVLALDRLRENSKELRRQQKEHEGSLLALREHRDQARQLEHDIEAKEDAVKTIQVRSSKLLPELEELRRVSASLEEVEHNIDGLRWESALIQGRIDERHDAIRRANLPPSTKSLEEMVQLKREFTQQIAKSDIEASGKSEQLTAAEQALRKREEEVYTSRPQIHQMEVLDEEHHDMRAKVHKLLELICEGPALRVEDMDVDSLCTAMNDAEYALDAARKEKTTGLSQLEEQLTYAEECLQAHLRLMDIDAKEHEMKENLIAGLMERAKESRDALKVLGDADAHEEMKQTEKDIALLEQRVEAVDALRRKGEHYQQRERLLQELAQQNSRVARLRQEMSRQKQRMDGQTELTVLRQQLKERQSSIKHVMERDILTQLVPLGVVEGDVSTLSLTSVSSKVEHARQQRSLQLAAAQREFSELERTCATLEQKRTTAMEELVRKEENLNRSKLSCQEVIGQQHRLDDFEGMLAEARQRATVLQQRRHSQEALVACYAEFVDVAKRSNVCPVCDRSLEDGSVLQHFIEINEARQKTSPEVVKASVQEATEAMHRLQQLENIQGKVMDVRTLLLRIPDLEESIRFLTDELENKKALRDDVASQREDAEGNLQRLNELSRQLSGLLSSHAEAESLSGQLARRENQLRDMVECTSTTDLADGKSFDDLTQEHEEAMSSLHQLNVQLSEVQRMEQDGSQVHVEEQLRVKRNRMYELGLVRSKQEDLMSTIQRYEDDMQGIQASVTVLKSRRVEQESTLVTLRQNLQEVRAKKLQAEKVLNDRFLNIEDHVHLLATILPKVSDYLRANNVQKLQSAKEDLVRLEEECKQYSAEVTRLKNGIAESRQLVDDQRGRLAEMERIIDVLEAEQSMEYDKGRLREVEQKLYDIQRRKLQGVNPLLGDDACKEPLPRLKERIRTKVSDLERQRSQWEGAIEVMLHDINSLRSQLSRDKYQNIEKRYRSTFLKVQTTEIAVKDIDKYYVALEKAVQSYHQEKIAQINQIIADLWRQTYRGSDIDTVEIRSETETTTTAAARRSYNYRVVMKRGNSEIDMRGRCSAGQKVLASVLIRLALSEAFCCDCGILALDEPTTNLDEDNARSLAEALRVLIETRRFVKHFQLIVITHDEQFVRALGGQSLDTFYYVHKDREGAFSVIEERTFDQLFT